MDVLSLSQWRVSSGFSTSTLTAEGGYEGGDECCIFILLHNTGREHQLEQ